MKTSIRGIKIPKLSCTAGLTGFFYCLPLWLHAHAPPSTPKIGSITFQSEGAMDPMPAKPWPYQRWLKSLSPTTAPPLLHRQLSVQSGDVLDYGTFSRMEKKLAKLPYLAKVSVKGALVDDVLGTWDVVVQTKDRFPLTVDLNLEEAALLTCTHHHVWGYGHVVRNQLFLKKRWGYGLEYELPKAHGRYRMGGQWYHQTGGQDTYRFRHLQLAVGKTFLLQKDDKEERYYWALACSGSNRCFFMRPLVTDQTNRSYHNHNLVLVQLSLVDDTTAKMGSLYTLHAAEKVPKGGSVAFLYGYQQGEYRNRQYVGFQAGKNVVASGLFHMSGSVGMFLGKQKTVEEGVLKLALDYATPILSKVHRQFVSIQYVMGYQMPAERMLDIRKRDPAELERPDTKDLFVSSKPIHARLNACFDRFLHAPISVRPLRFAFFGFGNVVVLYDRHFVLLNTTLVEAYGIGLRIGHGTHAWPALDVKIGYSPLLGKMVPTVRLSFCLVTNTSDWKPELVPYS
jgi:hypothetical protein